jgi:hypothetical protein
LIGYDDDDDDVYSFSTESPMEREVNQIDGNENIDISAWAPSQDKSHYTKVIKYVKKGIVNCTVTQTHRAKLLSPRCAYLSSYHASLID